jgi:sulfite reductase (ferredoxin)
MSELKISAKVSSEAKEDIVELNDKIQAFNNGEADEEKFRSFRLSRGVYGQRQEGVQMIRIKLPYGKVTADQLIRIADIADTYATEKMHLTTRQDIQIHYVKLDDSPKVWAELEDAGITLREACGNTVRNVTASVRAGIDQEEPFDVAPYAHAFFEYFLRNPICQEMGRKFKVSFSSSKKDSAYSFMHDVGVIPKIENGVRGFEVWVGGGLGSQPIFAHKAYDFLEAEKLIPFSEAVIRVFDRYGERASRGKARMKFLIKNIGLEKFMSLVQEQWDTAVINKVYPIDVEQYAATQPASFESVQVEVKDQNAYQEWKDTNVIPQKQEGYSAVFIKLTHGNVFNKTARALSAIVKTGIAADDIRISVNQGFMLKFVKNEDVKNLFNQLYDLDLTDAGFDSTADITACPGTDTCNLGIASSYGIASELERLMTVEYRDLIYNNDIKIKISGCMNACGQHSIANIGFQGMSIKKGAIVMPALQVLLGGGFDSNGVPTIADKVVKVPARRAPEAFSAWIEDYSENRTEGEYFNNYYQRMLEGEKMYFFTLLKPFTVLPEEIPTDFLVDWGTNEDYIKAVGIGECAGVILDLVGTLLTEAEEKFSKSDLTLSNGNWQDSIYHSYNAFVVGAKALLIGEGIQCNTQITILTDFDEHFVAKGLVDLGGATFLEHAQQLNVNQPSLEFAEKFNADAKAFLAQLRVVRTEQVTRMETAELG